MENTKPFAEMSYKDLMFMKAPNIEAKHGFTTRWGGVSGGYLDSLNLGENNGDREDNVRENYRRVLEALAIKEGTLLCYTKQVHGNEVKIVTKEDARELFTEKKYEADGIVTNVKGLPLICYTADCVPVLLCDSENDVVAAIHCGWRSSVADILGEAIKKMISLGAMPKNIQAAIGPAIDMCCFETDSDVPEAIVKLLGEEDSCDVYFPMGDSGKFMVDLKRTNAKRLMQLGVPEENISISDECTKCNGDRYWSHRGTNGKRGSQAAIIVL